MVHYNSGIIYGTNLILPLRSTILCNFQSFDDVLAISQAAYQADNLTEFGLVTFSDLAHVRIHRTFGQDRNYTDWIAFVTAFRDNINNPNSSYYPFFQGKSFLAT